MQEIFNALSNSEAQTFGGITPDILTRNLVPVAVNLKSIFASSSQGLKIYHKDISAKKTVCGVFSILYMPRKYLERNHQDKHLVVRFISVRCDCSTAAIGGSREGVGRS